MDFSFGNISTSGGSDLLMVRKEPKKKAYSYTADSNKDRKKRRKIRADAKAKGENISLSESKKRAGTDETVAARKATADPNKEIVKPKTPETIDLGGKEPRDMNIMEKGLVSFTNPVKTATEGFEAGAESFKEQSLGENILRASGSAAVVGAGLGLAAVGTEAAFAYAAGSSAATAAATTLQQVSRMGLRKYSGKASELIPGKLVSIPNNLPKAKGFASNPKTIGLTKSMLATRAIQGSVIAFVVGIFGSYPMAAWAKQEVEGGLKVNARDAREAGDFEMAEKMIAMREEMHKIDWHDFVPYENTLEKFRKFTEADILAVESEKRLIAKERGEIEFEGLDQGEKIAQRDKEQADAREARDAEFKQSEEDRNTRQTERDEEFKQSEEDRNTRQTERDDKFTADQEARDEKEKRNTLIMQDVWRLRGEGKFEEADMLELTKFE